MSDAQSSEILDLLQKIDRGYQPTDEETRVLKKTTALNLSSTKITKLPESIWQLANLQRLDLGHTGITELPASIGLLSNLQRLDLSFTRIAELPGSIWLLSNLQRLDLSFTRITELPGSIWQLANLQVLVLSDTRITELPESFGQLVSLQSLDLSYTRITELPESFGQLTNLQWLDLTASRITELAEGIGQLFNLRVLDLSHTGITELPEGIGELQRLVWINLSELTLNRIPRSLALRKLPFVDRASPVGVILHNTTLTEQNVSIFLESPELIPGLYEEQITLPECKVIFLGDGESGKSYTIQRFLNNGKKESWLTRYLTKETPGVEIADCPVTWEGTDFTIHFWDFGGQQLLHSMHRCFLTEKTCYVVTVKSREAKAQQRAYYWLKNVAAFAPKSPVLLYVNCWDNDDGKRAIDETRLRSEFPQIKDVVYCSAKEAGTKAFRTGFMDKLTGMAARSDACRQTVNRRWKEAKEAIRQENEDYLTRERYHEICQSCGIEDDQASDLLTFFNNLGVCFSYHRDEDRKELADYKLLNPVWLTNAIYAIIEEGRAAAPKGQIPDKAIKQMLCNPAPTQIDKKSYRRTVQDLIYKVEECAFVVDVAAAHNLCYRVNPETVFFPALCTNNTPVEALSNPADYPQHVEYLLEYDYLPDSVVHQLVIRCRKKELAFLNCWLRGFVIGSMDVHKAIVRMLDDDKSLKIDLYSKPGHPVYELFELLREELKAVNHALGLEAKEFIVDGEDRYTLISLLRAQQGTGIVYGQSGNERNAAELLGKLYADWMIPCIRVESGNIIVPIVPRTFHKRSQKNPALRRALYEAYEGICPYCGKAIPSLREMQVDHILPIAYDESPELEGYINYLKESGFDVENPDYIENYLPAHGCCNREKSNFARSYPLIHWHELALRNTEKVLKLMEKYKETT